MRGSTVDTEREIAGLNGDLTITQPAQPPASPSGAMSATPIADSLRWLLEEDAEQP